MMEDVIAESTLNIRVIERPGPKHQDTMMATNDKPREKCEQLNTCLICNTDKGGDCRKKEIVYELYCTACKTTLPQAYDGQSARNGYTRGKEHVDKTRANSLDELEKSVIWRHQTEKHNGKEVKWEMKVHKGFQKQPLDRMICEARRINARPKDQSLNTKQEHAKSGMVKLKFTSDIKEAKELKEAVKQKSAADREKWIERKAQSKNQTPKLTPQNIEMQGDPKEPITEPEQDKSPDPTPKPQHNKPPNLNEQKSTDKPPTNHSSPPPPEQELNQTTPNKHRKHLDKPPETPTPEQNKPPDPTPKPQPNKPPNLNEQKSTDKPPTNHSRPPEQEFNQTTPNKHRKHLDKPPETPTPRKRKLPPEHDDREPNMDTYGNHTHNQTNTNINKTPRREHRTPGREHTNKTQKPRPEIAPHQLTPMPKIYLKPPTPSEKPTTRERRKPKPPKPKPGTGPFPKHDKLKTVITQFYSFVQRRPEPNQEMESEKID